MEETTLNEVTLGLIQDLRDLRAGKITNTDARTRAQIAREILRGVHLALEGMEIIQAPTRKALASK
jgi:hypothetical protein